MLNDLAMDVSPPILPDINGDVNMYDIDGMMPLINAICEFQSRVVRQHLDAGIEVELNVNC